MEGLRWGDSDGGEGIENRKEKGVGRYVVKVE